MGKYGGFTRWHLFSVACSAKLVGLDLESLAKEPGPRAAKQLTVSRPYCKPLWVVRFGRYVIWLARRGVHCR